MAITTLNQKLAVMEFDSVWEPGIPLSPGAFGQDDKQQLLWGYPGFLWMTPLTYGTRASLQRVNARMSFQRANACIALQRRG